MDKQEIALCFKALSDETRVKIVEMLKGGQLCACKILEKFNITQPTLSYHMKMLEKSGIVFCEKNGIWNKYTLNNDRIKLLYQFLDNIIK